MVQKSDEEARRLLEHFGEKCRELTKQNVLKKVQSCSCK